MSISKQATEPSMEEILSSIRRIIAEEETVGPRPASAADVETDVLELTDVVPAEPRLAPPAPVGIAPAPVRDVTADRSTAAPTMPAPAAAADAKRAEEDLLLSAIAAEASTHALSRLTRALVPETRREPPMPSITVDRLVIDLLTPPLKAWLDAHLPALVERVVEEEVKKLVRRAELG